MKPVRVPDLRAMKERGEKIAVWTAYDFTMARLLDRGGIDVILVGDLFYERDTAARALGFLERRAVIGTRVLIGDPGRTYLPKERLTRLAEYSVPVTRELEDMEIKRTTVWELVYSPTIGAPP